MAFTSRVARVGLAEGVRMGVSTIGTLMEGNLFTQCSFNVPTYSREHICRPNPSINLPLLLGLSLHITCPPE